MKLISTPKFLTLRLAVYFLLALLLRVALLDRFPTLLTGDSSGYLAASYHIQQAADFAYTSRQAVMLPGYPVFLAIVALLTDISSVSIVVLQKTIGLLGLLAGYGIGHLLHSRLLGELLVLFLAFNPIFLFFEHVLSSETLFIFLLLLLTFGWLWWLRRRPTPLTGGLVGLLLGVTILTRANSLAFGLVIISGGFISLMARSKARGWQDRFKKGAPVPAPSSGWAALVAGPLVGAQLHDPPTGRAAEFQQPQLIALQGSAQSAGPNPTGAGGSQ